MTTTQDLMNKWPNLSFEDATYYATKIEDLWRRADALRAGLDAGTRWMRSEDAAAIASVSDADALLVLQAEELDAAAERILDIAENANYRQLKG